MWVVMLAIIQQATASMGIRLVEPWHLALPGIALQVRGGAFIGDDGRLDFRIEQGRVALVITPAIVKAIQQVEAGH